MNNKVFWYLFTRSLQEKFNNKSKRLASMQHFFLFAFWWWLTVHTVIATKSLNIDGKRSLTGPADCVVFVCCCCCCCLIDECEILNWLYCIRSGASSHMSVSFSPLHWWADSTTGPWTFHTGVHIWKLMNLHEVIICAKWLLGIRLKSNTAARYRQCGHWTGNCIM